MKKFITYIPILLSLLVLLISVIIINQHENQLKLSHPIYIKLRPVDPRSILQGDYMQLRYDMFFYDEKHDDDNHVNENLNTIIRNKHCSHSPKMGNSTT